MSRDERGRAIHARWARKRRRQLAYGLWLPYVDPTATRDHINGLRRFGLSLETIAIMAGEHPSALSSLMYPSNAEYRSKIRPERQAAYLGVQFDLDLIPAAHRVSSVGTARRLQALMRIGWSQARLASRLGVTPQAVGSYRARPFVSAGTARRVRDLFEELAMRPGPCRKAAGWAERAGWEPPLAWDDIDDPDQGPCMDESDVVDEVAVQRLMTGRRVDATRAERREAATRLAAQGVPDPEIAERIGVTDRSVARWRKELGIESRWSA